MRGIEGTMVVLLDRVNNWQKEEERMKIFWEREKLRKNFLSGNEKDVVKFQIIIPNYQVMLV